MNKENKIAESIEKLFPYFLLFQVIIDILTTFFVHILKWPISFGMFTRFAFIIIAALYIILRGKKHHLFCFFLLVLLNIYQMGYLYMHVPNLNLFTNARYYLRTSYYAIMVLFLAVSKDKLDINKILKFIRINIFLIIIVFIISSITNTGLLMYEDNLLGTSSWFTSGNEISSIMSMLSLVSLYIFLNNSKPFNFFLLLGIIFVLIVIGTKNSLIALILVLFFSLLTLIIYSIKHKNFRIYLAIFIPIFIMISINYQKIPAIVNTLKVRNEQNTNSLKAKYTDYTSIPEEILSERYKDNKAKNMNDSINSVILKVYKNEIDKTYLQVSGYLFPKYFDLSHPKFIEKTLILKSENDERTYELIDTFNKYVKENVDRDYNSDFSGLSGEFEIDDIDKDNEYEIFILIKIDGEEILYNITDSINYSETEGITKSKGKISINVEKARKDETATCKSKINIPLLSGRAERVEEFVSCNPNYGKFQFFFGSGYINNYTDSNGFEMDIIEIFITYGLIGFLVYFAMTFIILFKILIMLIKNQRNIFNESNYLLLLSMLLGFALAAVVGHTILTPAPAIYLSILMILVLKKLEEKSK